MIATIAHIRILVLFLVLPSRPRHFANLLAKQRRTVCPHAQIQTK